MRKQLTIVGLCLALTPGTALSQSTKTWTDSEVLKIHRSLLLIDGHNDVPMKTVEGFDIGKATTEGHTDLSRLKAGGTGAQFFAAYVSAANVQGNRSTHRLLDAIDTIRHDIVGKYPGDFHFATSVDEILAARRQGKIAALIGIEGGHAIEDDLRVLRASYDLGARYMTLTHTNTNNWADSSGDINRTGVKHHNGLTDFGKQVVLEMNRLGMLVDIAHVADKTFYDALEVSKAPIFSSHSSVRALCNHGRNLTDDMLKALAKKGGLTMINFSCDYLSQKSLDSSPMNDPAFRAEAEKAMSGISDPKERRAAMRKLMADMEKKTIRASIDDVVAHIDHVKQLVGVDYVGLGSDFDGIGCTPEGLDDVSKWPNLTRKLLEKGYIVDELRKIYGGNLLRVMREAERVSAQMKRQTN